MRGDTITVKERFAVSLFANVSRAGISFLTGVLIARELSPVGYGDLFFLLGSFTALRALMDMGTSQAFYTFISQGVKDRLFYALYFFWLLIQFFVTVLVIFSVLPDALIDRVWLGQSRDVILLAFLASFLQQQVWTTIVHLCESLRKTALVQLSGLLVVVVHLIAVLVLIRMNWLSVESVLLLLMIEYLCAGSIIVCFLKFSAAQHEKIKGKSFKAVVLEYWVFCRPLIILAVVSFSYEFFDRWLLQRFGGSEQQGFYQISMQFAAVSLLATASILNIFWKEIAEAYKQKNHARVGVLYQRVSRTLLMIGAIVACFLIPWAEQLTILLLGDAYANAWPVLAVMFLYPVHQSMGQINGVMFMACERTKPYMYLGLLGMLVSMPVTYFLLVPHEVWFMSGLGLGAIGLALKMVSLNILFVNIQGWFLARFHNWRYDWSYQVIGVVSLVILSFLCKSLFVFFLGGVVVEMHHLKPVLLILGSGILYLLLVGVYVWFKPALFGLEKSDVMKFLHVLRLVK